MNNRYYSLVLNKEKKEADINIFGDITSMPMFDGDVSANNLVRQLETLQDVKTLNVHISSFGGEVGDGLAIFNSLKKHKAKVKTYCEGMACSIASVIFMAGDERIMSNASLLMIHNAWTFTQGNADELRKQADDLDVITSASINAYLEKVNINENQLKKLMDNETWLTPEQCLEMGFATSIENGTNNKVNQSIKHKVIDLILQQQGEITIDDEEDINEEGGDGVKLKCSKCGYIHEGELPEFFICPECGASKDEFAEIEETEDEEVTEAVDDEEEAEETTEEETDDSNKDEETEDVSEPEKENKDEDEKEVTNEKVVAFFNAIAK